MSSETGLTLMNLPIKESMQSPEERENKKERQRGCPKVCKEPCSQASLSSDRIDNAHSIHATLLNLNKDIASCEAFKDLQLAALHKEH